MDDLELGERLALPYESDDTSISVPAKVTGIGLPAVRVETDSGEVFIRRAKRVREWSHRPSHA